MKCTDVVILAGGSGERLWPLSDTDRPKQFITLDDGSSFLQAALSRALALEVKGTVVIITRESWVPLVIDNALELLRNTGREHLAEKVLVMGEPVGRNTAPPLAWACSYLLALERGYTPNILVMASDHVIAPMESFVRDVRAASRFAEAEKLVSLAIRPTYPATGYGYIKAGPPEPCEGLEGVAAFTVDSFVEKPDFAVASEYLAGGGYFWNSGMYAFRADFFLEELARHRPDVARSFSGIEKADESTDPSGIRVITRSRSVADAYDSVESISIDYAVSEKCARSVSVRATFHWDDVGSWDSFAKYSPSHDSGVMRADSENCFVYSDIPVQLCGVDDLVVVIHGGKALVSRKGKTDIVRNMDMRFPKQDKGEAPA